MSERAVWTSPDDHELVVELHKALGGGGPGYGLFHNWHVLRLALTASLRLPVSGDAARGWTGPKSGGPEYRLQQVTGEHKEGKDGPDLTNAFRAVLGSLHGIDLFHRETGEEDLMHLLEYHVHRGLQELHRRREEQEDGDVYALLLRLLAEGEDPGTVPEAPHPTEDLQRALADVGVRAEVRPDVVHGPRLTRYAVRLAQPGDLDRLRAGLDKLAFWLGHRAGAITCSTGREAQVAELDLPRPPATWRRYGVADRREWLREPPAGQALPMCPGVDQLGNPFWIDLAAAPHVLVAGATGSGKSVCLHALLCSLLERLAPSDLQVCLIDPKHVELSAYDGLPHVYGGQGVLTEGQEIEAALASLVAETERRYAVLERLGVRDVAGARREGESGLPWVVAIVEELADLVLQAPEAEQSLVRLAQKSRASGIHLVLATQRPDAETFRGLLRSNVDVRIALAVQKASESRIILDQGGAEGLLKPGDMLVRRPGRPLARVHGVFLGPEDINGIVEKARRSRS